MRRTALVWRSARLRPPVGGVSLTDILSDTSCSVAAAGGCGTSRWCCAACSAGRPVCRTSNYCRSSGGGCEEFSLNDVDRGEQTDPDNVDKVPVIGHHDGAGCLGRGELGDLG